MKEDILRKHIDLYVNDFSLDLGEKGKTAIEEFLSNYQSINSISKKSGESIFLQ